MAIKHLILQGFVDINLEIDENINTKILPKIQNAPSFNIANKITSKLPISNKIKLPTPIEEIIIKSGFALESVQEAHVQGSALYGVGDTASNWDIMLISTEFDTTIFKSTNIDGVNFNINIISPKEFQKRINAYNMTELEFNMHPDNVILINNKEFTVKINNDKLINAVKLQSDELWIIAKDILDSKNQSSYIAKKNIWHSFRFLIFAEQILKNGVIIDFSAANYLYDSIVNSSQDNFSFFETNFSILRNNLKLILNAYLDTGNLNSIDFKV